MKKLIIFSIFSAAIIYTISASAQQGFYIGAQGAQQFSGMYNNDDANNDNFNYKATIGETFGLSGGCNITKHIGVATEAMYSIEGQRYEINNVEFTKRLNYLKVPLMFTYNTDPGAKVMFIAKAGPQVAMLMRSSLKDDDGHVLIKDTKDDYEKITFGAVAGLGARVNLAQNLFLDAGLRMDGNFVNSEKKSFTEGNIERAKTYNMNAGLEVGIKYFFN